MVISIPAKLVDAHVLCHASAPSSCGVSHALVPCDKQSPPMFLQRVLVYDSAQLTATAAFANEAQERISKLT